MHHTRKYITIIIQMNHIHKRINRIYQQTQLNLTVHNLHLQSITKHPHYFTIQYFANSKIGKLSNLWGHNIVQGWVIVSYRRWICKRRSAMFNVCISRFLYHSELRLKAWPCGQLGQINGFGFLQSCKETLQSVWRCTDVYALE